MLVQAISDRIRAFVKDISKGGPVAQSGAAEVQASTGKMKLDLGSSQQQKAEPKAREKPKPHAGGKRTFESTEKFYARAKDIYDCFTDAKCISAYTQSPAKVSYTAMT